MRITDRPIRIGIVGGNPERGWAKDTHIPALATLSDYVVNAVSARSQDIADATARAFGVPRAFGDSLALVRDPEIDVIVVTVKVPEHRAIVLAALAAGKHVYCEWPLGRNAAEAEELSAAADRAGTHVVIGLQGLSAPAVQRAASLVAQGAIGQPLTLRVLSFTAGWGPAFPPHYAYLQDKRNGATLLSVPGGHTLAAMEAIVGPIVELDARTSVLRKTVRNLGTGETIERNCPDHMLMIARHASGCVSSLEVIGTKLPPPFRFELSGSKGRLAISGIGGDYQADNLTLDASDGVDATIDATQLKGSPANVAEVYRRFAHDLRHDVRTVPDFRTALRLTRLLDAIDIASETGRRQKLEA